MSRMAAGVAIVAAGLAPLAGCAHSYVYVPLALGTPAGPVVRYAVPPESPRGDVYVTSFGFTELDAGGGGGVNALHVRLAVANGGPNNWALDGREQQLVTGGQPPVGASFLNSDAGPGPLYVVPAGQTRVLDLYYVLPPPLDGSQALGSFTLAWRLLAGAEPISQNTAFARVEEGAQPYGGYPPFVAVGLGVGVGWWFGPRYAAFGLPLIRGYYYPPARVRASGVWHGAPPGGTHVAGGASVGGGWRGRPAR